MNCPKSIVLTAKVRLFVRSNSNISFTFTCQHKTKQNKTKQNKTKQNKQQQQQQQQGSPKEENKNKHQDPKKKDHDEYDRLGRKSVIRELKRL